MYSGRPQHVRPDAIRDRAIVRVSPVLRREVDELAVAVVLGNGVGAARVHAARDLAVRILEARVPLEELARNVGVGPCAGAPSPRASRRGSTSARRTRDPGCSPAWSRLTRMYPRFAYSVFRTARGGWRKLDRHALDRVPPHPTRVGHAIARRPGAEHTLALHLRWRPRAAAARAPRPPRRRCPRRRCNANAPDA